MKSFSLPPDLEALARRLEMHDDYRVLRRAPPLPPMPRDMTGLHRGVIVDVETTGLDPDIDGVIQIAVLPFAYDADGVVIGADAPFVGLEEPLQPIPPKVTALTGLTQEMISGAMLDDAEIETAVGAASIVIAHNAAFDRKFLERRFPFFERLPFGCSMTQVSWEDEGYEGKKLAYLMMGAGFFHDAHDAAGDCAAAATLLAQMLPTSGRTALSHVLEATDTPTRRIWAVGAPYAVRRVLKSAGYRWNAGEDGRPKAWFKDAPPCEENAECSFLAMEVYRGAFGQPRVVDIDAFSRFSSRA